MHIKKLTGGVLLIAGTCVGAGMLALPITMGSSGFFISTLLLILCWLGTYLCGLYVLEANLSTPENSNYISMAKASLGPVGEIVAWITYLLLLYSLMATYLIGGGGIVHNALQFSTNIELSDWVSPLPWVFIVGLFLYAGTKFVDGLNRLLFTGLIITYFLLVFTAVPHVSMPLIAHGKPGFMLIALPVLSTAFGYHVIIPSLRNYLHGNVDKLTKIILLGSAIPLIIYIAWDFVVFGSVPIHGPQSLTQIYANGGDPALLIQALADKLNTPWLMGVTEFFIFFAISSSFLGISLSLFDFLADGLNIKKNWQGKMLLAAITFIPPLFYAWFYPSGFLLALGYAGVFVAILHGILPAAMVVSSRKKGLSTEYRAPGGMTGITLIIGLCLLVIGAQIAINIGVLAPYH